MAEPADQIVGRTAELGSLDGALAELQRDRWSAVEIVGEPGIGKTRLLAELGARAEARGHLVLAGSASELEGDLPFGVFVDALDDYVAGLEPRRLNAIDEAARAELPHVLPSLPGASRPTATLQIERYRTHRAMGALLETLAAAKPLVLLLDDVHWADSGSVELLGSLLRRPPAAPVLVALTVRPRQMPERLGASLQRAHRAGDLIRLDLAALDAGAARELLGAAVGAAEAEALHAQSGGNPFYLQELARHPDAPNVAAALGEELTMLDDAARRVLEGAAVAGDPFEPDLAGTAAGVSEAAVVDALDELLLRDLVRHTDVPRRFRFRHPLVRRAVYEGTPGGWRLGAHERCARALAERGAPAATRAHHVEHAARHGDAEAVAVLREAGEATALRTPAGAARWFTAALRLLPATAPPPERIELLMPLARAHVGTGQLEEAGEALSECLRLVPPEAITVRVRLSAAFAGIERALGRHDEARARLRETLAALPDQASADAAALMVDLAIDAALGLGYERVREWGDRALAIARPLADAPLTAAAAGVCTLGLAAAGMSREAEPYWEEAVALVDAMTDDEAAVRLDAVGSLAAAEGYLDRFEGAVAHAQRGFAVGRATGQEELLPILTPALVTGMAGLGRLADALEHLDGAVESARVTGNIQPLAWNLIGVGLAQLLAGRLDAALASADEAVEVSRAIDASAVHSFARMMQGQVLVERGESRLGVETMIAAAGGAEHLPTMPGTWQAWALDHLAKGWLAAGHRDAAGRAAERAEEVAASTGLRFAAAAAQRARCRLALADGEPAVAAEHALAAVAGAGEVGARLEEGISRVLAGRALAEAGDPERAAEELQRAVADFDACGAPGRRGEAERELGKLGVRTHRRTRPGTGDGGIESLTERELEVARLVVDRRTNAEIASALYLSTKTVETHMRNLFHKLGVSSRVDVARTVERADRAGVGDGGA